MAECERINLNIFWLLFKKKQQENEEGWEKYDDTIFHYT